LSVCAPTCVPSMGSFMPEASMTVPVTTLDKAIDEFGVPTFCKIHVEGFESDALKGLSKPIPLLALDT
jgi:FkbM family methyltransferase